MNWFSGTLVIKFDDGSIMRMHSITFSHAQAYLDCVDRKDIKEAMYEPYPTQMEQSK